MAQIRVKYRIPEEPKFSSKILDIVKLIFVKNPEERPTVQQILMYFYELAEYDPFDAGFIEGELQGPPKLKEVMERTDRN